jgi:hypothetical protein
MSLFKDDDLPPTGGAFDPETGELFPDLKALQLAADQTTEAPTPPASERAAETISDPNPEPLGGRSLDEALFRASCLIGSRPRKPVHAGNTPRSG